MSEKNICFVIGAPRSGTNMLRDFLCNHPNLFTFDCDETPYLWRVGKQFSEDDYIKSDSHSSHHSVYMKSLFLKYINKLAKPTGVFIEKTCANSLRVKFLSKLFPEAKFIFIFRSGIDVVSSARKKQASKDIMFSYIYKKIKYIPVSQYCLIALSVLYDHLVQRRKPWGPRIRENYSAMSCKDNLPYSLLQWRECVRVSIHDQQMMAPDRYVNIVYDQFVASPDKFIPKLADLLGVSQVGLLPSIDCIYSSSIGKGFGDSSETLTQESLAEIENIDQLFLSFRI